MAARGRPTPQLTTEERPRFRDRRLYKREGVNPYVESHRTYDSCLMPADQAWTWRGRWRERFGRAAPLVLEVGAGNGEFLVELAARNPDIDFVAIELRYKRCVLVAKKLVGRGLTNAVICRYHAAFLDDLFDDGELAGVWMNHPDPWPKERHEKNRLVSRWFLEDVARLVAPGGFYHLKSDHRPNVDRAVEVLDQGPDGEPAERLPFDVVGRAEDVTRGPAPWPDDIETLFQSRFRKKGEPVYAVALRRR
jgi:tRNA (guanine-N7-)-methyltransferase